MTAQLKSLQMPHGRLSWRELGEGPPLVLIHGWSMSHAVFSELATLLSTDYRLFIPDLPGHGGSDAVDSCSLAAMAQILYDWLNEIALNPVSLLGWSLGGQVALKMCANFSQLIERLILISSTPCFCVKNDWPAGLPVRELRALQRGLKQKYQATMGDFFDLQFKGEILASERRREILQFAVRPVGLPAAETALAILDILGREDLRPILADIKPRTLVLHGEIDVIIPLAAGQFLAEQIPSTQFISVPEVGHSPFFSCPQLTAQYIRDFCR